MSDSLGQSDKLTTQETAQALGYRSSKSVYRLVKAGVLKPLPWPKCPLHFWRGEVVALQRGVAPVVDRWL